MGKPFGRLGLPNDAIVSNPKRFFLESKSAKKMAILFNMIRPQQKIIDLPILIDFN